MIQLARRLSDFPGLRDVLRLVKQGVPWDVAVSISPARRLAMIIACGELDGGRFDWHNFRWRDPDPAR